MAAALHARRAHGDARARGARRDVGMPWVRGRLPGDARGDRYREPCRVPARGRRALRVRARAQCARGPRAMPRRSDRTPLSGLDRRPGPARPGLERHVRAMIAAPLPLLGTFHEISVVADDMGEAVEFYERLGFRQAPTGDTFSHPYGVLTDGRLFIGLPRRTGPSPVLTFVRPGVAASLAAFAAAGIQLTHSQKI